jgi:hypothetical protein
MDVAAFYIVHLKGGHHGRETRTFERGQFWSEAEVERN